MGFKFKLFKRSKEGRQEEREAIPPSTSSTQASPSREEFTSRVTPVVPGKPVEIGFISGKGGCGKSTIASSTAVLLSALYGGAIAVDLDIANSTLTALMFSIAPGVLVSDAPVSTLHYLVSPPVNGKYAVYKLKYPPDKVYTVALADNPKVGLLADNLYVLPGKKNTPDFLALFNKLGALRDVEVRENLFNLREFLLTIAKKSKAPFIIYDFPPMRPDTRKAYTGVYTLLEMIENVIVVNNFDPASLHGVIATINERYAYVKRKIRGVLINMAVYNVELARGMEGFVKQHLGVPVDFIRRDTIWSFAQVPPIVVGLPNQGANGDLVRALTRFEFIDPVTVRSKLHFDPLEVRSLFSE